MPSFKDIYTEMANLCDFEGELTPEIDEAIAELLDELVGMEEVKIDATVPFIKSQEAKADALKAESKRLASRAKAIENSMQRLKAYYVETMQYHGKKRASGKIYEISLRASESVQVIVPAEYLPDEYKRIKTTTEPDKTLLKQHLKSGVVVDGVSIVTKHSLTIK